MVPSCPLTPFVGAPRVPYVSVSSTPQLHKCPLSTCATGLPLFPGELPKQVACFPVSTSLFPSAPPPSLVRSAQWTLAQQWVRREGEHPTRVERKTREPHELAAGRAPLVGT